MTRLAVSAIEMGLQIKELYHILDNPMESFHTYK